MSTLAISEQIRAYKQENGLVSLHFCKEFREKSTDSFLAVMVNSPT